jgi:hypothetical protein
VLGLALVLGAGLSLAGASGCEDSATTPPGDSEASVQDAAPGDARSSADDGATDDLRDAADATEPGACPPGTGEFAIQRVDGTVTDGAKLVVCGDAFGELGPTIVLFDDMEGGQAGTPVPETAPVIGEWLGGSAVYAGDAARSGSLSMVVADTDINEGHGLSMAFGVPDAAGRFGLQHFDELFVSWAIRDLGDFPGHDSSPTTFSSDSSAKDIWVMFGRRGDNYSYSCSQGECNGNDLVLCTHTGSGSFKTDGNNTASDWWLPDFWQFQTWNVLMKYVRIDPTDPYGTSTGVLEHVSAPSGYLRDAYNDQILKQLAELPPVWDRLKFGAWYRQAGDVRRVMDDLYVAVGPGAAARVEIANAPQVESATKLAISTAHAWSNGRIELTARLGDLDPAADSLHLFVVNADNERSPGFALTP